MDDYKPRLLLVALPLDSVGQANTSLRVAVLAHPLERQKKAGTVRSVEAGGWPAE